MKIKKLITINWSNLENREYVIDDILFLTGQTGVGKSTFLDAIQTVFTAAHHNIVNYNAAQDETNIKQKDKEYRTLGGYILGEDRGLYSRPYETTGTVALTFVSSPHEPKFIFNAILNVKCSLEEQGNNRKAVVDDINLLIIKGNEVSIENLLEDKKILFGDDLYNNLARNPKFTKEDIIHLGDKKEEYLSYLFGHLWGIKIASAARAKKAARALTKFIYAKPVHNINKFVRDEFLEEKNMAKDVTGLSNALITLKEIKKESEIIENGINELKIFSKDLILIKTIWEESFKNFYIFSRTQYDKKKNEIDVKIQEYSDNDKKMKDLEAKISILKEKNEHKAKRIHDLLSKRNANENFQRLNILKSEMDQQINNLGSIKLSLRQQIYTYTTSLKDKIKKLHTKGFEFPDIDAVEFLLQKIDELSNIELNKILNYNESISKIIDDHILMADFQKLLSLTLSIEELSETLISSNQFKKSKESFKDQYLEARDKYNECEKTINELNKTIYKLQNKQIVCPDHISAQYDTLCRAFPDLPISMLYQHVDIKQSEQEWAYSIEGFLKNNRFAVVVPCDYEYHVVQVAKNEKLHNLKIIQSKKMLQDLEVAGEATKENSIITKLVISNDIVKAYLINNYKNVLCLESEIEVKAAGRGITREYKAANGGLMFYCKAKDLFFGEKALQQMLHNTKVLLESEKSNLSKFQEDYLSKREIDTMLSDSFFKTNSNLKEQDINFDKNYYKYLENKDVLSSLSSDDYKQLENLITKLSSESLELDTKIGDMQRMIGSLLEKKSGQEDYFNRLNKELGLAEDSFKNAKNDYLQIVLLIKPGLDIETTLNEYDNLILDEKPSSLNELVIEVWNNFVNKYLKSKLFEQKEILYHENREISNISFNFEKFKILHNENKKIKDEILRLENSLQMRYKKEIEEGEKNVKKIFVEGFCVTMNRNIKSCKEDIDEFSDRLMGHKFENDQFLMVTLDADPEYEEYKKYFKYIAENKDLIENSGVLPLADKEEFEKTKNKLLEMFLDGNKRSTDLERIADYRNYAKYDIMQIIGNREISLSKNGKNSGGQGETSYYIVRSINLHAALNPPISKTSTLEALLIDESFVKTNDERAKEIISYLNKTLGFQIIMALPTKGANELLKMDSSNYNIIMREPNNGKNGELDYITWARYSNNNAKSIIRLIESEKSSLFKEAEIEGKLEYART